MKTYTKNRVLIIVRKSALIAGEREDGETKKDKARRKTREIQERNPRKRERKGKRAEARK